MWNWIVSVLRWDLLSWAQQIGLSGDRETSLIYWAQLSRFHLKTETESSPRNVLNKSQDDG
jgi:hypothetical protein